MKVIPIQLTQVSQVRTLSILPSNTPLTLTWFPGGIP